MTQLAIKPQSKYPVVHHHKTTGNKDLPGAKTFRINTTRVFNASHLNIAKADLTIVAPKAQKQKGYLSTKRNLLLVTIIYAFILATVLFALL